MDGQLLWISAPRITEGEFRSIIITGTEECLFVDEITQGPLTRDVFGHGAHMQRLILGPRWPLEHMGENVVMLGNFFADPDNDLEDLRQVLDVFNATYRMMEGRPLMVPVPSFLPTPP